MENPAVPFHEMGLDDRLLKAISKLGWAEPTLIQERAIPLALEGKDVLARARTGSGKTAAYIIPIIHKLLVNRPLTSIQETKVLVMAPSRELCKQIYHNFMELTVSCCREVKCLDISGLGDLLTHKPLLNEHPDVVIGTPSRILAHMKSDNLNVKESLEILVIDEADLLFAFGFEDDTKAVIANLPSIYQAFLMSATLSEDVNSLKKLILHNAVILKLEEPEIPQSEQLIQYHIRCEEEDKFVLIYALFKLRLIRGRTLIFVSNVDRCYRMKLYLEQFGISACALNAELPINSRQHIVSQFNEGKYDIIVASDDRNLEPNLEKSTNDAKGKSTRKKDKEFGVSRGIDFRSVSNVINFDFPLDVNSYIHRVGRAARGKNIGTALSFVSGKETPLLEAVETAMSDKNPAGGSIFKPYQFKMEEIESFRYRAKDAIRSVTSIAVRESRLKEIKKELLTSQKLKTCEHHDKYLSWCSHTATTAPPFVPGVDITTSYFEDNPRDFHLLRHDRALHTIKLKPHLQDVPEYIVPSSMQKLIKTSTSAKKQPAKAGKRSDRDYKTSAERQYNKRKSNPLKSFEFSGLHKKMKKNPETL